MSNKKCVCGNITKGTLLKSNHDFYCPLFDKAKGVVETTRVKSFRANNPYLYDECFDEVLYQNSTQEMYERGVPNSDD